MMSPSGSLSHSLSLSTGLASCLSSLGLRRHHKTHPSSTFATSPHQLFTNTLHLHHHHHLPPSSPPLISAIDTTNASTAVPFSCRRLPLRGMIEVSCPSSHHQHQHHHNHHHNHHQPTPPTPRGPAVMIYWHRPVRATRHCAVCMHWRPLSLTASCDTPAMDDSNSDNSCWPACYLTATSSPSSPSCSLFWTVARNGHISSDHLSQLRPFVWKLSHTAVVTLSALLLLHASRTNHMLAHLAHQSSSDATLPDTPTHLHTSNDDHPADFPRTRVANVHRLGFRARSLANPIADRSKPSQIPTSSSDSTTATAPDELTWARSCSTL